MQSKDKAIVYFCRYSKNLLDFLIQSTLVRCHSMTETEPVQQRKNWNQINSFNSRCAICVPLLLLFFSPTTILYYTVLAFACRVLAKILFAVSTQLVMQKVVFPSPSCERRCSRLCRDTARCSEPATCCNEDAAR